MAKPKVSGLYDASPDIQTGFPPLDEGDYLLETIESEWTTSKTSGNPMLKLQHQVLDGPEQEDDKNIAGRRLFSNLAVTDKPFTIQKLKNACVAHGVEISKQGSFDEKEFIGKKVTAKVGLRMNELTNEPDNNIETFYFED